jgi:integrase
MDAMAPLKTGPTQRRWTAAMRDKAFDLIRQRKLMETASELFLQVLNSGTVSTNMFLRRLHNFAVGMHWPPWPVLPKLHWPPVRHKDRRAITAAEHQTIIARELNPEIRAYYQLLWHLGGSQTDIAELTGEDVDWKDRTISYRRGKTNVLVIITFGAEVADLLESLPKNGPLFPRMARIQENHRAKMFIKRLRTVGITGISLRSYRYAWEERAKTVGMPERFAQQALGHSSKAIARAYSKKAQVIVPSGLFVYAAVPLVAWYIGQQAGRKKTTGNHTFILVIRPPTGLSRVPPVIRWEIEPPNDGSGPFGG